MTSVRPPFIVLRQPLAAFLVMASLAGFSPSAFAEQPAEQPQAADAAKETFAKAQQDLRRLIGELSALQAEYHQPDADKQAIESRFNAAREEARAAATSLESSATDVLIAEPDNATAKQVVLDALQGAMATDDPLRGLDLARLLQEAGSQDEQVLLTGATAAMIVSDLDAASTFLKAASDAGVDSDKVSSLEQALETERPKVEAEMAKRAAEEKADDLPRVKIETSKGTIVVELFENEAPNAVANFISLIEKHFYDGTVFHRVIPQFMAQGGDPKGTGSGGLATALPANVTCQMPASTFSAVSPWPTPAKILGARNSF
jgi:hypothetical protein